MGTTALGMNLWEAVLSSLTIRPLAITSEKFITRRFVDQNFRDASLTRCGEVGWLMSPRH